MLHNREDTHLLNALPDKARPRGGLAMLPEYMTVEEAAKILGCDPRTIRNLLYQRWLEGKQMGKSLHVATKSLFQIVVHDRASHLQGRTWSEWQWRRKNFFRFCGKTEVVNCLGTNEERGHPAAKTGSENSPEQDARPLDARPTSQIHHESAANLQFSFGWLASKLAPDDPAMQDDLIQEMSLAVLECSKPGATKSYLIALARCRALNYLAYERLRGMLPLEAARAAADQSEARMASLDSLIEELTRSGIPPEWIEEVLGVRLAAG